jgi:hypothetical protein
MAKFRTMCAKHYPQLLEACWSEDTRRKGDLVPTQIFVDPLDPVRIFGVFLVIGLIPLYDLFCLLY